MTDGLKDRHRDAIIALLAANDRVEKAVLFGSRAMQTGTNTSDVAIALFGDKLSLTDQARLAAAIDEIPMAQSVDLVLHRTIDHQPLIDHIQTHGVEWYRKPDNKADSRLHLRLEHRRTLEALLREHLPDVEVWAYGGRVNGRGHDHDGIDLALRGPGLKEIPASRLAGFEHAVRESTIPFLVEAKDWALLPERLQRETERRYVVVRRPNVPLSRWRRTNLGQVAMIGTGKSNRQDAVDGGEFPLFDRSSTVKRSSKYLFDCQAVIVPGEGREFVPKYFSGKFDLHQRVYRVTSTDELSVSTRFLYYLLLDSRRYWEQIAVGSTVKSLRLQSFTEMPVGLPPIGEQRTIAHILGTLDDKIESNRRMNATLEAMARAIFKDWFVDFGPTRAKMEGRSPYLPPDLWNLFPEALDEEDKPLGWQHGSLADIAESPRRGVSPADVSPDTPYIGLEHMPRRSIALSEWEGAGKVKSNKTRFNKGDILFGKLRPYFHKVGIAPVEGICSTDIIVAVPQVKHWGTYTLSCLSSDEFVDYTDQTSTGTRMPRTSWKTMAQYKLCLPPERVACAYQDIANPLLNRLAANIRETSALAQTRDILLPKLISGELRGGDWNAVEETA